MQSLNSIPVIDLFAGPGGLGEGFSSVKDEHGQSVFDIKLSIEKDQHAIKTLIWRSFYRQFSSESRRVPDECYQALRETDLKTREAIIEKTLDKFPEGEAARKEAQLVELGSEEWPAKKVDKLITERLGPKPKPWVLMEALPARLIPMWVVPE